MTTTLAPNMLERIKRIEVTPAIPAILLPLMELLKAPSESVEIDEVVRLVSYDNAISAQCLRAANSPLFGLAVPPKSVSAAVVRASGVDSPDMLHGAGVPVEEVGFGSSGFLEALAGMRDGLPEIQRETGGFGRRDGVHGGSAA
jgi:hypothetical protein